MHSQGVIEENLIKGHFTKVFAAKETSKECESTQELIKIGSTLSPGGYGKDLFRERGESSTCGRGPPVIATGRGTWVEPLETFA